MRKLLIILLALIATSCYDIDREFKHITQTWELRYLNDAEYPEIYQWVFDRQGKFYFADGSEISEDYEYTVQEGELCLYFTDTECFDLLKLTKDDLWVQRRDLQVVYKFKSL